MRYQVAICDDETATCAVLEDMTERCFRRQALKVNVEVFYSGEALADYIRQGNTFDFILLDIQLCRLSGLDMGKLIRDEQEDINTQIIFISSSTMYAMQLFKFQPLDFIEKPVKEKMLEQDFSKGMKFLCRTEDKFQCTFKQRTVYFSYNSILYFVNNKRKIEVVTDNMSAEFYGGFGDIIKQLPECFLQVSRNYIINANRIKESSYDYVVMSDGTKVLIGRNFCEEIRDKLIDWRI